MCCNIKWIFQCLLHFMAATIWIGFNRVTRHSQRPLSHKKCTNHLKPMASRRKTLGPSRQTATSFVMRGTWTYFLWKVVPSTVHVSAMRNGWETLAYLKSHVWWAFFKCDAELIIKVHSLPYSMNRLGHLILLKLEGCLNISDRNVQLHFDVLITVNRTKI